MSYADKPMNSHAGVRGGQGIRAALFAGLTFVLAWCVISGVMSGLLPLLTGIGAVPPRSQVLIGLCGGAFFAIFPAALVAWLIRRRAVPR